LNVNVAEQAPHRGQHRLAEGRQQGQGDDQGNDPGQPPGEAAATGMSRGRFGVCPGPALAQFGAGGGFGGQVQAGQEAGGLQRGFDRRIRSGGRTCLCGGEAEHAVKA
jgi:hypothetical protein